MMRPADSNSSGLSLRAPAAAEANHLQRFGTGSWKYLQVKVIKSFLLNLIRVVPAVAGILRFGPSCPRPAILQGELFRASSGIILCGRMYLR